MKQAIRYFVIGAAAFSISTSALACSAYDMEVLNDQPVIFLPLELAELGKEKDISRNGHNGTYYPAGSTFASAVLPNGDDAVAFDGTTQYLEVADADALSVPTTGVLTVEAWMRPDTLQFSHQQSSGYVHWMGKGAPNQHEYVMRMYSLTNTENRPNRISGYAFNPIGSYGSGSYFQDTIAAGEWIHVTAIINTLVASTAYPTGYVKIFKNGVLRDTTALNQYNVIPANGTAPLRIGTRDLGSFFKGAIGKVAMYNYEITPERLQAHYGAMCGSGC